MSIKIEKLVFGLEEEVTIPGKLSVNYCRLIMWRRGDGKPSGIKRLATSYLATRSLHITFNKPLKIIPALDSFFSPIAAYLSFKAKIARCSTLLISLWPH